MYREAESGSGWLGGQTRRQIVDLPEAVRIAARHEDGARRGADGLDTASIVVRSGELFRVSRSDTPLLTGSWPQRERSEAGRCGAVRQCGAAGAAGPY